MVSLAVPWDALLYAENDDVHKNWRDSPTTARLRELEGFVTDRMGNRGRAELVSQHEGSYNIVFRFSFGSGGSDVALRSPKPGHAADILAREKTANEVSWMQFLQEKTRISVPHVYSYGTELHVLPPHRLPYILMDWLPCDTNLRDFLASNPPIEV